MAVIQALLAMVARSAGKLLNTAFGWATVLLFGKVPEERQGYLSLIAFGSVAWLVVVLGIAFPAVGVFLLAFVPLPDWVDRNWVRLAMLVAAVLIPLIVGFVSLKMLDPEDMPQGAAKAKAVLKGYPYTLGLAVTLLMMVAFAPVLKIGTLIRRWASQHVPIMVEPEDYLGVVEEIERALKGAGWETVRHPTSWMLRAPTKVLTTLAGGAVENLVADELTTLRSESLEVVLHPSDLVISGPKADVAHARAIVAEQLAYSKAYMTWTKDANELEDRLSALWHELQAGAGGFDPGAVREKLHAIERDLKTATIEYEEWEVLFREKLLVERGLLEVMAGTADRPPEPAEARPAPAATAAPAGAPSGHGSSPRERHVSPRRRAPV